MVRLSASSEESSRLPLRRTGLMAGTCCRIGGREGLDFSSTAIKYRKLRDSIASEPQHRPHYTQDLKVAIQHLQSTL